jgi:SAM-dependent methyltransferase
MVQSVAKPKSSSEAALKSYEELGARMEEHDPRDQYTYMYSKFRSDYTLMERVGMTGKSVLNVGCSFPVDELYYARKVASWTAIDLSPQSIDGAERILQRELHPDLAAKFRFQLADACDLPFEDGTFDVTVSMSTFDQMPPESHQKAVDEMARTTKPGGHVIVTVANKWNPPYAAGIRKMMREKTLHYGYAYLFTPVELRKIGERAGLAPAFFASSISPPDVWLPGYPAIVRWPAELEFRFHRAAGYLGRRVGYAFGKPIR